MEDISKRTTNPLMGTLTNDTTPIVEDNKGVDEVVVMPKLEPTPIINYPIQKNEIVWVKRRHTQPVLPVEGITYEVGRDHKLFIGPAFAGPNTGKLLGRDILTLDQEKKYMPQLINVSANHTEWDKILNTYWETLQINVPYDGLQLEVGTIQRSATEEAEPINLFDWLLHKYCTRYAQCANSRDQMGASDRIRFYLWKDTEERALKVDLLELEDKATLARLEIVNDIEKVKSIIILAGHEVPADMGVRRSLLADIAKANPVKFIEMISDKMGLEKAFVQRLINVQLMSRPLNSTLVVFDGSQIGRDLAEAAMWLKQPQNSETYLSLRSQLEGKEVL